MGSPYTYIPRVTTGSVLPADVTDLRNIASVNPVFQASLDMASANLARIYTAYSRNPTHVVTTTAGSWDIPDPLLTTTGIVPLTNLDRFVFDLSLDTVSTGSSLTPPDHFLRIAVSVNGGSSWTGLDDATLGVPESNGVYHYTDTETGRGTHSIHITGSVLAVAKNGVWTGVQVGIQQYISGGTGSDIEGLYAFPGSVRLQQFCMGT